MLSWHRFRLLVCIALMLAMLGGGLWAWLVVGTPEHPYGRTWAEYRNANSQRFVIPIHRSSNPLRELRLECGVLGWDDFAQAAGSMESRK